MKMFLYAFLSVLLLFTAAIVLLIVAHALRHVQIAKPQEEPPAPAQVIEQPQFVLTPEMIDQLRQLLRHTTVEEEVHQEALPSPKEAQAETIPPKDVPTEAKLEVNNYERVKSYLADHPKATLHEIAGALTISVTTANKWRGKIRAESTQGRRKKARSS